MKYHFEKGKAMQNKTTKKFSVKNKVIQIIIAGLIGAGIGAFIAWLFRNANLPPVLLYVILPIYLSLAFASIPMLINSFVKTFMWLVYLLFAIVLAPVAFIYGCIKLAKTVKAAKEAEIEEQNKKEFRKIFKDANVEEE
ncbi:MAG: hypothetical protein K5765_04295 [Clostridia bacterium]|nr:hypothetical protein [Clostridia bacterium]